VLIGGECEPGGLPKLDQDRKRSPVECGMPGCFYRAKTGNTGRLRQCADTPKSVGIVSLAERELVKTDSGATMLFRLKCSAWHPCPMNHVLPVGSATNSDRPSRTELLQDNEVQVSPDSATNPAAPDANA